MTSPAPVIGATTEAHIVPYLSRDMFKYHARRGVQISNLVPGGTPADQDASLAAFIEQGTTAMNSFMLGSLAASLDTEAGWVTADRKGYLRIHPRFRPALALTAFSIGSNPATLQAYGSLAGAAVEPDRITIPSSPFGFGMSSQGPIQFGSIAAPLGEAWAQWTYLNGFAVTWLTAGVAAGATSLPLADTTGIIAGQTQLTIQAGQNRFRFIAGAVSNAVNGLGSGAGNVVCPALPFAVTNDATYPTYVTALPADVIYAAVCATRALIKKSGGGNISAPTTQGATSKDPYGANDDMATMYELLDSYQVSQ